MKKLDVATNVNFVVQYNGDNPRNSQFGSVCCAFTRSDSYDLMMYVPKAITDKIGFSKKDIELYLEVVNSLDLSVNVVLNEETTFKGVPTSSTGAIDSSWQYSGGASGSSNARTAFLSIATPMKVFAKDLAYPIKFNRKANCRAQDMYVSFMLVRYLYNHQYFEIADRIINFNKAVPDADSNFIVMASHMLKVFDNSYAPNGYYCLVDLGLLENGAFLNPETNIKTSISGYSSSINSSLSKQLKDTFPINIIGMYKDFLKKGLYAQAYYLLKKNIK